MSAEAEAPAEQRKKRQAAKQTGTDIIHSLWDECDEDYAPVDHATYSGNIWNLFEVSYIADGKENTFSYDARGNRISEIETYTGSNGRVTDYEYYENSDLIKKAGNWYFNYDKNGNLTARGTEAQDSGNELFSSWTFSETEGELWTYEYDLQNRMTKANYSGKGSTNLKERESYVYDYRGLLIKKSYQNYNPSDLVEVVNAEASKPVTEFYEYTADGKVIYNERSEDNNTKKTTYIWANTTLWCEVNNGVVYYHHTDHLGTTEVVTDSSSAIVWEAGYEAFGSVLNEKGDSKFTPSYTGKFFDKASGLYYFNARWYDSELGKFTVSDPIRDGVNWWNYCNGNPLSFVDWLGLEPSNLLNNETLEEGCYVIIQKNQSMINQLTNMQNEVLNREDLKQGTGGPFKRKDKLITPITTWCNQATFIVSRKTDHTLAKAMYDPDDPTGDDHTNAAHVAKNLAKASKDSTSTIREVSPYMAQLLANAGVTVAGTKDVESKGHVATVAPGFKYDKEEGPMMANVGGSDLQGYTRAKEAFRDTYYEDGKVHFYVNIKSVYKVMSYMEIKKDE